MLLYCHIAERLHFEASAALLGCTLGLEGGCCLLHQSSCVKFHSWQFQSCKRSAMAHFLFSYFIFRLLRRHVCHVSMACPKLVCLQPTQGSKPEAALTHWMVRLPGGIRLMEGSLSGVLVVVLDSLLGVFRRRLLLCCCSPVPVPTRRLLIQ